MPLALAAYVAPLDTFTVWQIENEAVYCERLHATITDKSCAPNRQRRISGDWGGCGCSLSCGGLYDQNFTPEPAPPVLVLVWNSDEKTEHEASSPPGSASRESEKDAFAAQDAIIDRHYEEPEADDDFDDVEIELSDEQLLALFPELALEEKESGADTETNFPRFTEYQEAMPLFAVYKGRCRKCGGYVDNTRERNDDNVFRCVSCGWRTGPEYETNRKIYDGINQ